MSFYWNKIGRESWGGNIGDDWKKIPGAKRLDEDAREIRYPSLRRHFRLYRMYNQNAVSENCVLLRWQGLNLRKVLKKTFSKLKRQNKTTATTRNTKSDKRRPLSIIYIITNIPTKGDLRLLRYDQKFTIHIFRSDINCFFVQSTTPRLTFSHIYIRSVSFFWQQVESFNSLRHNPNQSVNPKEWFFSLSDLQA